MESINKIIEGLEHCDFWSGEPCYENDCPYYLDNDCLDHLKADIINLLKQQEDRIRFLTRAIEQMPKPTKLLDVYGDEYAKVIRCKDCKYCGSEIRDGVRFAKCELKHNWMPQGDWFCADGEKGDKSD